MHGAMSVTTWRQYRFEGCIPHCVCFELGCQLLADLVHRYRGKATVIESCATSMWKLNYVGVYDDPPVEKFAWFGLDLRIPCWDVWVVKAHLDDAELRTFDDGAQYYKLKGEATCIVMTPIQAAALRQQLAAREEVAEQHATAFFEAQLHRQKDKRR